MNEKYYTPELEEFHYGFEYQIYEDFDHFPEKSWINQTYGTNGTNPEEMGYVPDKKESIRVKHLDQEDIESFGFKYIKKGWLYDYKVFRYNGIELYFRGDGSMLISPGLGRPSVIFEGTVKNKSEFSRLLRQLGIK